MIVYVKTQNGGTLNLRQSTSSSSAIIAQIPNNTRLDAEKVNESWMKTTYKDKTGFVMTKYLAEPTADGADKTKLQAIYSSLKSTLELIEDALK